MVRLIKASNQSYVSLSNQLARDERLSWKAKGIFLYLWSQADNWQFYQAEVQKHATDGGTSLRKGLDELTKFGYLKRRNRHKEDGSFDGLEWILSDHGNAGNTDIAKNEENTTEKLEKADIAENKEKPAKKLENTDVAKIKEKAVISSDLTQSGKSAKRKTRKAENRTLSNNNSKKYQIQEITSTRNNYLHRRSQSQAPTSAVPEKPKAEPKSQPVSKQSAPKQTRHAGETKQATANIDSILTYLNQKTGKRFSLKTATNRKWIRARLKEGFTVQDCKTVIDKKFADWHGVQFASGGLGDDYMTPVTLFRPANFERYLNETPRTQVTATYRSGTKRHETGTDWSQKQSQHKSKLSMDELQALLNGGGGHEPN